MNNKYWQSFGELKESEEFTSSLLTNTPNPIFVTYPDSTVKYVNPAFEKLTGISRQTVIDLAAKLGIRFREADLEFHRQEYERLQVDLEQAFEVHGSRD